MAHADKPPSKQPASNAVSPVVQSTVEREIKLAVDDHFRLPTLPGTPIPRRRLTSTYYDTSQYDLAHASVADVRIDHVSVVKDGTVLQRFRELEIE